MSAVLAILIFYILIKKKIRKRFNYELNDKINEALANYYGDDNSLREGEDEITSVPQPK